MMDQVVVDMHTKSGLLEQIRASTITLEDAGAQTLAFIKLHVPEARRVPLCGNSIGIAASLRHICPRSRTICTTAVSTSAV